MYPEVPKQFVSKYHCYVCTDEVEKNSLLCSSHRGDWETYNLSAGRRAGMSLQDWAMKHRDFTEADGCPKCFDNPVMSGDYLCESCRYG